ncbi:MAG: pyridoxal 5'-phosphate synthase glutaminase subunit PdxT [Syntrophomonadaceae bacterium]|nr:pyridoxal 5'-phosphate synthase glutaminase subunit PdxT [Syntrophomonadaceae bacterium]
MAGKKVIGVLALQGAFVEHEAALRRCGAKAIRVRRKEELEGIDGLIIPGGESTSIGRLLVAYDLAETIVERSQTGMPIFGTCAGMIVMAKEIPGSDQFTLGLMDISARRNAFGRQVESFEADLDVKGFPRPVRGIFIRAPYIDRVWGETEVLSVYEGKVVMARERNLLTCSFHPELTTDLSIHKYFLDMA